MRYLALPLAVTLGLVASACGGDAPPPADAPAAEAVAPATAPTVSILEPADGAEVDGPRVTIRLTASGIGIVPAGQLVPGTGHHHLYLNADLTPIEAPVPTIPGQIVHLGQGESEWTFESVPPGRHRLIAVVADGLHVPIQPWVVDTIHFTVRQP